VLVGGVLVGALLVTRSALAARSTRLVAPEPGPAAPKMDSIELDK
jgi:hypothetical protein